MAGRREYLKVKVPVLDLENLPGPAKHSVLMQLRVFDWHQLRQVPEIRPAKNFSNHIVLQLQIATSYLHNK